jgi:linoleoyl-CoA desaturase
MRDKHINISPDSSLLKLLYAAVDDQLKPKRFNVAVLLLLKFIFYFLLLLFCYYSVLTVQHPLAFLPSYIGLGLASILLGFNFAHDFSHNTVFKNKKINSLCFIIIYTIVGAHAESWRFRHIHSHHYAPNVKDYDSDLQITDLIRVEPGSAYKWFHCYQHWYAPIAYMSYSLYWVFIKDMLIYFKDKTYPKKKTITYHLSFWLQKAAYVSIAVIVPLLFSAQQWYITVTAFIVMHLIQSAFLLFTFFITHHVEKTEYFNADSEGYIKTSWINNQVKSSNDFYPFSQAANFIFGGFNNHIAHHLFPHINHVYYPRLNRILYRTLRSHHIEPNATGFFSGIISHLKHLRAMGVKPCDKNCNNCTASIKFDLKGQSIPLQHIK